MNQPQSSLSTESTASTASTSVTPAKTGLGSTIRVGALTFGSRILGLVREQLLAVLLGASNYADAFLVAFRIPNLLRDLFAEGALTQAFVPTFAKEEKKGLSSAYELANRAAGALLLVTGLIAVFGILFAHPLVSLLAPGFEEQLGKAALTALLARIMMPFLTLVSLAAIMAGMLNAKGRFGIPALAPSAFNTATIMVGGALYLAGVSPETAVLGWSLGTVLGGLCQLLMQLPALHRLGFRFSPTWKGIWNDKSLRSMAKLMGPAILGLAAVQINIFVNTQFASSQPGANAWLSYALRLVLMPVGIFGVAIATVTGSRLARRAAEQDISGICKGLSQGMRQVAFLTLPSSAGLIMLAQPIIEIVYQHGRFQTKDTQHTATALIGYAIGLYAWSGVKVASSAYYAMGKTRIPMLGSISAVATNVIISCLAFPCYGYVALAVGTSLGSIVNLILLFLLFRRVAGSASGFSLAGIKQFVKTASASMVMAAAIWGALRVWASFYPLMTNSLALSLVRGLGGIVLGSGVYLIACRLFQVSELQEIGNAFKRRKS